MGVHVFTWSDRLRGESYDLTGLAQGLADFDGVQGDLMAGWDVGECGDLKIGKELRRND
jgi:hypothetical protein